MTRRVAIIGGGLVGCLAACYLGRRGYQVDIYERRPDPRGGAVERGRSINLAISERGIDALRRIGLLDTVMAPALPMHGRMIHDRDGKTNFQSYSARGDRAINSISRADLNATLLDAAEATPGVAVHFSQPLAGVDLESVSLLFDEGHEPISADIILGADGAGSIVRHAMVEGGRISVDIEESGCDYKELTMPPVNGDFAMDPDALHIWPRGATMMIALPNPDKSFTCTLFWPKDAEPSLHSLTTEADILGHFAIDYADSIPLIPNLVDDFQHNPIGRLATVHSDPWQVDGRIAIIGDAAHGILPFFGQGANCGFEDVVELDRCLEETGDDWSIALPLYQQRRRENAEAIAWLAKENFIEMRDRVNSPAFKLKQTAEHALERVIPSYISRYEMVSFTTIPYADVIRKSSAQNRAFGLAGLGIAGAAAATTAALAYLGFRRKAA